MTYKVDYTMESLKALCKMDPSIRTTILEWIDKNLEGCENPRIHGKPLKGDKKVFGGTVSEIIAYSRKSRTIPY